MSKDPLDAIDWQQVAQQLWTWETQKRLEDPDQTKASVLVSVRVDKADLASYLQLLRTWDVEHDSDSAIAVLHVTEQEAQAAFDQVQPPFAHRETWQQAAPTKPQPSRSQQRRLAAQRGEPAPEFSHD